MYISTCTTSTRLQPSRLAPVLRQAISEATGLDTHDASSINWTPAVHGNPGGSKKHTADCGQGQPSGGGAASPQQNKEDRWSTYLVATSATATTSDGGETSIGLSTWEGGSNHYYTNFTGGRCFRFPAAGKAVRRGLEATVNRGLTAVGGFARRG